MQPVAWAAAGTGFTCLMTVLGSSMVFFFRKGVNAGAQRIFLGFAAGVMVAASVWSLLIPAIEEAEPGVWWGGSRRREGSCWGCCSSWPWIISCPTCTWVLRSRRAALLLETHHAADVRRDASQHPRGHGCGIFLCPGGRAGNDPALYGGAMALAMGMGIQNFPEGRGHFPAAAAGGASLLEKLSLWGLSGVVEPIFGILAVLVAGSLQPLLPWLLAFAAGAMLYVVVEELIPEAHWGSIPMWAPWASWPAFW